MSTRVSRSKSKVRACRQCGCTNNQACPGGCWWVGEDLCSACAQQLALSIRQPWAWLVTHGYKDIENRTWRTNVRGQVLIHAAIVMTHYDYAEGLETAQRAAASGRVRADLPDLLEAARALGELERGGIVGAVDIVDSVVASASPWFTGPNGFVLRDPVVKPFTPCKGSLGFFRPKGLQ